MNQLSEIKGIVCLKNEPLAPYTSFRIGGKAHYIVKVYSYRALGTLMQWLASNRKRFFVIGAGTNILVNDQGYKGVVIKLAGIFTRIKKENEYFNCGSALSIRKMIEKSAFLGYGGAEFLAGIPGTIGGGIKGNAGAFGRSFADIVHSISVLTGDNKIKVIKQKHIGFKYRKSKIPDRTIILNAFLTLRPKTRGAINREIARIVSFRQSRQPKEWSAGSFFKNPKGQPAGKLIDECGLKGCRIGDAQVSKKHANFIVNRGNASAAEVMKLATIIKRKVFKKTGIKLQMEVRILK